ncbi:30S ribosomal protein S1, partial [Rhodovulum adriaticum]|nr:30S ribosomal protein S1 [Rhodovulum adriaticum]
GNVSLSTSRVEGLKNWKKLLEAFENNEIVKASVKSTNSGGLVVKVMGINGFIPASQITTYFVKNFNQFVGQELDTKILSIDEKKKRVVLSSRVLQEEKLDSVWETLTPDAIVTGKVVRMVDFGAFVDLGGVDGLIHISDISWDRIEKPSDVLEVGQEVEVKILKANRERNRVS